MSAASRLTRLVLGGVLVLAAMWIGLPIGSALLSGITRSANTVSEAIANDSAEGPKTITALGRLAPKDGVRHVAGPSQSSVVLSRLLVDKGDRVVAGQVIAVLDSYASASADLARVRVELDHARSELDRLDRLYQNKVVSLSERDNWRMRTHTLDAERQHAEVVLDLANVRAPIDGQVLDVHTRAGEKVGPDGILELAQTDKMYAIAEVYETDIASVRPGQRATVHGRALGEPLQGTVEHIGLKIGKADVLGVDPIAKTDARVIEVEIRLDDSTRAAGLTNAQVEIAITP